MTYKAGYFMPATADVIDVVRASLAPVCDLVTLSGGRQPVDAVQDLDFLIAGKVTRPMIEASPKLKLIMTPGVGYDGIDLEAAAERQIPVAVTICGNTDEVAEFTLLLMLATSRNLIELDSELRVGRWMMWERRLQSFNLKGRTLGLLGFGRIGQAVAQRASAFGMEVQYHDPFARATAYRDVPFDDLLATSDYLSLHLPLTSSTRGLLDESAFSKMKPGSILINTARGEIVDEAALLRALDAGRLRGAGLDVFEKEPLPPSHPFAARGNVVITPHIASGTADGLRTKAARYLENIELVLAEKEPIDRLHTPERQAVRTSGSYAS